jgi:hypothetical protein
MWIRLSIRRRYRVHQRVSDSMSDLIETNHYKICTSLVSAKWGPKLTIALQSVTTRKGGSGPNRFHYDRWALSRRPLLQICNSAYVWKRKEIQEKFRG